MTVWKGLPISVLDEAGVTVEDGLVFVPYRLSDGSVHNRRVFAPNGRAWWETSGKGLVPFGVESLPGETFAPYCAIAVSEGESDCLAFRAAFQYRDDARAVAYYAIALPGARTWRPEWRALVELFPLVYVLGDGDPPGHAMDAAVVRDVPWARPVGLPDGLDVRAILQADARGLDEYLNAADEAKKLSATFALAKSLEEADRLLAGETVVCRAA